MQPMEFSRILKNADGINQPYILLLMEGEQDHLPKTGFQAACRCQSNRIHPASETNPQVDSTGLFNRLLITSFVLQLFFLDSPHIFQHRKSPAFLFWWSILFHLKKSASFSSMVHRSFL